MSFLAGPKHANTMPATFTFTKFVPKKIEKLSTLRYHSLIHVGIVDLMVDCLVDHPTNHVTMVEPFAATAAWMWRISPPHPWEPLWKGLAEGGL